MIVKEGMYCKTDDGKKVGPVRRTSQRLTDPWPFVCDYDGTSTELLYIRANGETQNGTGDYTTPDLISEWPSDGPVRTVTRREIVPGVYGAVRVDCLGYTVVMPSRSPTELRAAAATLIEIADALEDGKDE